MSNDSPNTQSAAAGTRSALVGVDESLSARLALEHAAQRVRPAGRLLVAHVVPLHATTVPMLVPADPLEISLEKLERERREIARELVERLAGDTACPTEARVLEGPVPETLARVAREDDVDELVVGARGLGRFVAALGSVSHAVLHEADRRVVIVPRAAADRVRRLRAPAARVIVVGYDGSPAAQAAIDYALAHTGENGRVVAVHAYTPTPDWLGWPDYDRVIAAHQAHGRELLHELERRCPAPQLETSLLEGAPARALLGAAQARDADEIAVGSRGFSPLRAALGSVSHALLHEADRPVVVIPTRAVASEQTEAA
jgi:nucleotide-binding universal stress UspA family protein